jgi:hypothetical protein
MTKKITLGKLTRTINSNLNLNKFLPKIFFEFFENIPIYSK